MECIINFILIIVTCVWGGLVILAGHQFFYSVFCSHGRSQLLVLLRRTRSRVAQGLALPRRYGRGLFKGLLFEHPFLGMYIHDVISVLRHCEEVWLLIHEYYDFWWVVNFWCRHIFSWHKNSILNFFHSWIINKVLLYARYVKNCYGLALINIKGIFSIWWKQYALIFLY